MQRRFLGDAKDSFKWDYHDFLARELGVEQVTVALMVTPDGSRHGDTDPKGFPACPAVIELCKQLRASRDVEEIANLPRRTGADYAVALHRGGTHLAELARPKYFSGFDGTRDHVVFVDPDNGFEPEKSCTDRHVAYDDVAQVLEQISVDSVVSVFQYFRRIAFVEDFARIRDRLGCLPATAVYWQHLMFVVVARADSSLKRVIAANRRYATQRPVEMIV